uniref:Uncharacterized protein n=1 Tax=Arundo donax TaxID=35708 RepID=A0A0A9EL33_ARUDO
MLLKPVEQLIAASMESGLHPLRIEQIQGPPEVVQVHDERRAMRGSGERPGGHECPVDPISELEEPPE